MWLVLATRLSHAHYSLHASLPIFITRHGAPSVLLSHGSLSRRHQVIAQSVIRRVAAAQASGRHISQTRRCGFGRPSRSRHSMRCEAARVRSRSSGRRARSGGRGDALLQVSPHAAALFNERLEALDHRPHLGLGRCPALVLDTLVAKPKHLRLVRLAARRRRRRAGCRAARRRRRRRRMRRAWCHRQRRNPRAVGGRLGGQPFSRLRAPGVGSARVPRAGARGGAGGARRARPFRELAQYRVESSICGSDGQVGKWPQRLLDVTVARPARPADEEVVGEDVPLVRAPDAPGGERDG
mmetsp:Transcript_12960/g.42421  ORF Transcript_12960/g.42421 Transcript_12960/m.42421 type:complete len:297 (+) Transcript_12960:67-957(+)|eukprot:scaffold21612_cov115-Isochrysis_galbana.AAC.2